MKRWFLSNPGSQCVKGAGNCEERECRDPAPLRAPADKQGQLPAGWELESELQHTSQTHRGPCSTQMLELWRAKPASSVHASLGPAPWETPLETTAHSSLPHPGAWYNRWHHLPGAGAGWCGCQQLPMGKPAALQGFGGQRSWHMAGRVMWGGAGLTRGTEPAVTTTY